MIVKSAINWTYYRYFSQFKSHVRHSLWISFVLSNIISFGVLLAPLFVKVLFDVAYPYQDVSILFIFSFISFFLLVVLNIFTILKSLLDRYIDQSVNKNLYHFFYTKCQKLPLTFFYRYSTGELMYRFTQDLDNVSSIIIFSFFDFLSILLRFIFLLSICAYMSPSLTLLALFGVQFDFIQTRFFALQRQKTQQESQRVSGQLFELFEERLSNIKLVKIFHNGQKEIRLFLTKLTTLFVIERKEIYYQSSNEFFSTGLNQVKLLILTLYTGLLIIQGDLSLGEGIAISTYTAMLSGPIKDVLRLYTRVATSMASFRKIKELFEHKEEYDTLIESKKHCPIVSGHVSIQNVSFSYKTARPVLQDLTIDIPTHSSFALVGRSGIGKSSLVDLILKFYTPTRGKIFIDGHNISNINTATLRRHVCLVAQHLSLFNGTIFDNIAYGLETRPSIEDVITATKKADAHEFISALPKGYQTKIGNQGIRLSAGQNQRVAIARALIINPKIIIFDEATATLDSDSERQLQHTIVKLQKEHTIIIITHRLSAVKFVDKIAVLSEEGHITEEGTFQELMQKKSVFFKLYHLQFGDFQSFIENLRLLVKSADRYHRPLSAGLIQIENFASLTKDNDEHEVVRFTEGLTIKVMLSIREVDICSHQQNGLFWVAFPETNQPNANLAMSRIVALLNTTEFPQFSQEKLHYHHIISGYVTGQLFDTFVQGLHHQLSITMKGGTSTT